MKIAKECVTTHLPNGLAPKMDGAQARIRNPVIAAKFAVVELEVAAVVMDLLASAYNEQWWV